MNEQEFRSGVLDNGERLMQPFADSKKAAEMVNEGTLPTCAFDYIAEALKTLSPQWHGDMVARHVLVGAMNNAIVALDQLDRIKKTLFYGRDNNLAPNKGAKSVQDLPERCRMKLETPAYEVNGEANIIHAILGIATEAGELLEALRDAYNGNNNGFDKVNLKEECGDLFWYQAILASECGFTFDECQQVNIAKLRARFPDKFTERDANNRDLIAERAILQQPNHAYEGRMKQAHDDQITLPKAASLDVSAELRRGPMGDTEGMDC